MLHGDQEGQLDRLARHGRGTGFVQVRRHGEEPVGGWLQPQHLTFAAVVRQGQVGAFRAAVEEVQAGVGRDPVQPRPQRRSPLEGLSATPGPQERLLDEVLRVLVGRQHAVTVHAQLAPVGLDEFSEDARVLAAYRGDRPAIRCVGRLRHQMMGAQPGGLWVGYT
jgi:hypothetical protein